VLHFENERFTIKTKIDMETKLDNTTEHQHDAKLPVGSSTSTKELLECTVCWGGGKIEIDDFGNEENCTWCNGTGLVSRNL
jgi:DnaJ-class molecular chaperone